ncbi:hypothetical protein XINFAN_02476 [Pseudogemmobacter humi]|uniref:Uncharacterized protein n=1 Tax=Pseudogemmobacter humi TaxID=2483812 RepID=A0A3P5XJ65_9RHOB|nr:hypothetical protein XINFAN_02476 [Pseudogemmobacter humi]
MKALFFGGDFAAARAGNLCPRPPDPGGSCPPAPENQKQPPCPAFLIWFPRPDGRSEPRQRQGHGCKPDAAEPARASLLRAWQETGLCADRSGYALSRIPRTLEPPRVPASGQTAECPGEAPSASAPTPACTAGRRNRCRGALGDAAEPLRRAGHPRFPAHIRAIELKYSGRLKEAGCQLVPVRLSARTRARGVGRPAAPMLSFRPSQTGALRWRPSSQGESKALSKADQIML